jgi:hypothetical protein
VRIAEEIECSILFNLKNTRNFLKLVRSKSVLPVLHAASGRAVAAPHWRRQRPPVTVAATAMHTGEKGVGAF